MKDLARSIWKSIKRNPVLMTAIVGIVAQAYAHSLNSGDFSLKTISTYAFQLALAAVAREFTVPLKEHDETKDEVSRTIVRLEADFQKRLNEAAFGIGVVPIETHDKVVVNSMKKARDLGKKGGHLD